MERLTPARRASSLVASGVRRLGDRLEQAEGTVDGLDRADGEPGHADIMHQRVRDVDRWRASVYRHAMHEDRDVVVVGGGIAGLTAVRELRDLDPLVLEASARVGGRIWSRQRGDLALSVGAHMFPPPGVRDRPPGRRAYGLEVLEIRGSMLNIALGDRLVRDVRPELFPLRLPLPPRRASRSRGPACGSSATRRHTCARSSRGPATRTPRSACARCSTAATARSPTSWGRSHPAAFRIFEALANRSTADPDEISQSAMCVALRPRLGQPATSAAPCAAARALLPDALGRELAGARAAPHAGHRASRRTAPACGWRTRARTAPARCARGTAIVAVPATQIGALVGDAADAGARGRPRAHPLRAARRALDPHGRDRADAVGRPLLGADAGRELQHVLQPRERGHRARARRSRAAC